MICGKRWYVEIQSILLLNGPIKYQIHNLILYFYDLAVKGTTQTYAQGLSLI